MVSFVALMATLLICPTRRKRDGMNWEIVSSINAEMGRMIDERVIADYKKVAAEAVNRRMAPVSGPGPA
jgi:DNA-binding cell septation regulator SpoVG